MRLTDALQYLPQRGLSPLLEVDCASMHCKNRFVLANAVAFPARRGDEVFIAFFCSDLCLLNAISPEDCAKG
jgi:hypothetical protein